MSVHDFGWSSGDQVHLFLVMEYVAGPSLSSLLAAGEPLALRRTAGIVGQTLAALGEAHHLGITHRDMKPENIMLQPTRSGADHVKVIDFGIAQLARGKRLTEFGGALGTPEYMAPEQVRGEEVGPSADLYSVGVILFQMLTGSLPFQGGIGGRNHGAAAGCAADPIPTWSRPSTTFHRELASACVRALSVDPADRFADAAAFAEALELRATACSPGHARIGRSSFPQLASGTGSACERAPLPSGGRSHERG